MDAGHDVTVLTYRPGDFYSDELSEARVPHVFIGDGKGDAKVVKGIAEYVDRTGTEVLISFLTGANLKACLAKCRNPRLRLIVSERNCNLNLMPHDMLRFRLFERCADAVVCNSFAQEEFIRKHCGWLSPRLYCIPNFVDFVKFFPNGSKVNAVKVIAVMARVCSRKNTVGLILAASRVKSGFRIEWHGLTGNSLYAYVCKGLIRLCHLEEVFALLPASHNPEEVYRDADFFCLPSFYEGTSNAIAEALSCGLPAICSDVSDNHRYVEEGRNGFLFNPHRTSSIAGAITRLLELSPEEMSVMKSQSLKVAAESYGKERLVRDYEKVIGNWR